MDFGLAKSTFLCFIALINLILCRRYGALIELGSHYANWTVYIFLYYELHRDQGWSLSTVKNTYKPPVVYATDRSKAVVPVLFLILCSFVVNTMGRFMF